MTAQTLDGKAILATIKEELRGRVAALARRGITPGLGTVLVGNDPGSTWYVGAKHKDCADIGLSSIRRDLQADSGLDDVLGVVRELNADPACTGFLVQQPTGLDENRILAEVDPEKDVDGLHPTNLGWLVLGNAAPLPCTPYGIVELLASPAAVARVEASPALGAALLRAKGRLDPATADGLRVLVKKVVEEIIERLRPPMTTALTGARQRHRRSPHASSRTFDWRGTIAANLANVDPATGRMRVEQVRFVARQRRRNLAWEVIVLVDQSGSMADSLLHSAVTAAILAGLPGVTVRLVLFDTSVVDLSHLVPDPVEVLGRRSGLGHCTHGGQTLGHDEPGNPHRTDLLNGLQLDVLARKHRQRATAASTAVAMRVAT